MYVQAGPFPAGQLGKIVRPLAALAMNSVILHQHGGAPLAESLKAALAFG